MAQSLYLIVELRGDRYAIPGDTVTEVIPYLRVKALPGTPAGLAGLANYRGTAVPVVDLHLLAFGAPTPTVQSARIVMLEVGDRAGQARTIGLLVPRAHTTMRLNAADFLPPPIDADGARFLGPVLTDAHGVIQRVTADALLTPELLSALDAADSAVGDGMVTVDTGKPIP